MNTTTPWNFGLSELSGILLALAGVIGLWSALRTRAQGGLWTGQALFSLAFLCFAAANLLAARDSVAYGVLAVSGAALAIAGFFRQRSERAR